MYQVKLQMKRQHTTPSTSGAANSNVQTPAAHSPPRKQVYNAQRSTSKTSLSVESNDPILDKLREFEDMPVTDEAIERTAQKMTDDFMASAEALSTSGSECSDAEAAPEEDTISNDILHGINLLGYDYADLIENGNADYPLLDAQSPTLFSPNSKKRVGYTNRSSDITPVELDDRFNSYVPRNLSTQRRNWKHLDTYMLLARHVTKEA